MGNTHGTACKVHDWAIPWTEIDGSTFVSLCALPSLLYLFAPLERDSTKGWGFVLTNLRVYVCVESLPSRWTLVSGLSYAVTLALYVCSCRVVLLPSPLPAIELTCLRAGRGEGQAGGTLLTCSSFCRGPHQPGPM